MDVKKFEELVKKIDKNKYHINRTLEFSADGPYISEWAIFRKDMSIEEYFDPSNLAVLSSANGNTLVDIEEFIKKQERGENMGGKYEIRFHSNSELGKLNGGFETIFTNNWFEFMKLRITKNVIYYKVYCL